MDPTLRQVRALLAVAQVGSFTKAAKQLNISQPALTVQIRNLEHAIGAQMLDRNSRGVALTRLGQELLPDLLAAVGNIDAVLFQARELGAGRRGTVSIAALPSFAASFLPTLIEKFRRQEPHTRFVVKDVVANVVNTLVRNESVDFGLTGGAVLDPDLEVLQRASDRLCVVYPESHALARKRRITIKDLVDLPLVLMAHGTSVRAVVDAAFATNGRTPQVACEPIYMMTAVTMVRAGLGVTILPGSAREINAEPTVRASPIADPTFIRPISLIRKRGRTSTPVSNAFFALCVQAMRAYR